LAQQKSIDAPSAELKSTCKKHETGIASEERVKQLFLSKGHRLLRQRFKTPYSEVDLLFQNKKYITMVEVKSSFSFTYISKRQLSALSKSYYYLSEKNKLEVRAHLALVEGSKIHIVPDFL